MYRPSQIVREKRKRSVFRAQCVHLSERTVHNRQSLNLAQKWCLSRRKGVIAGEPLWLPLRGVGHR
jgi:hypothetical protein